MNVLLGLKEYFKNISKIEYEGKESDNPLAYRWYDKNKIISGKTMEEHFKFAISYWHIFNGIGSDFFSQGSQLLPWLTNSNIYEQAKDKADAAFEFITKLDIPYFCFHDYDLINEGNTLRESERRLEHITDYIKEKQKDSGVKILWGAANLSLNKRYVNGAATNPNFKILTYAAAQVKMAIDTTIKLGGQNYVFWGGCEGYNTILNTNIKKELNHLARFYHMVKDYARKQGFKGNFFIKTKPELTFKHQHEFDASTTINFLREYDLLDDFKLVIEANHTISARNTFKHELQIAANANVLGSINANRGNWQNEWNIHQFPNNLHELIQAMLIILENDGFKGGGINFEAKLRRNATDLDDLFHAHIGAIDVFARALIVANHILTESDYSKLREKRYASFDDPEAQKFENGLLELSRLVKLAKTYGEDTTLESGKQEYMENLLNRYI